MKNIYVKGYINYEDEGYTFSKDGCYICSPRCIIFSRSKEHRLDEIRFDALRISEGTLNRFYSNRNMIDFDLKEKGYFKFKDVEETISEEVVNLNGETAKFELSIMKPGWTSDGIITFDNYDSLLRLKYDLGKNYKSIIKDLNDIDKFLKFCSNRMNVSFDYIFLEIRNEDGKYEKVAEINIPYMIENEMNKV